MDKNEVEHILCLNHLHHYWIDIFAYMNIRKSLKFETLADDMEK